MVGNIYWRDYMGFFFDGFFVLFGLAFVAIFGVILFAIIMNIIRWNKNNHSPELTVYAAVVTKRTQNNYHNNGNMSSSSSIFFVTFEFESGDRMELRVPREEFGLFVVGDCGSLTFRGTRYIAFERDMNASQSSQNCDH